MICSKIALQIGTLLYLELRISPIVDRTSATLDTTGWRVL